EKMGILLPPHHSTGIERQADRLALDLSLVRHRRQINRKRSASSIRSVEAGATADRKRHCFWQETKIHIVIDLQGQRRIKRLHTIYDTDASSKHRREIRQMIPLPVHTRRDV